MTLDFYKEKFREWLQELNTAKSLLQSELDLLEKLSKTIKKKLTLSERKN